MLVRVYTVHDSITLGHQKQACPNDERTRGLRVVMVRPFTVIWCPCGHSWPQTTYPYRMWLDLLSNTVDSADLETFAWEDGPWPEEVLSRYPGLDKLVARLGNQFRHEARRAPVPHDLVNRMSPNIVEARQTSDAVDAFLADNPLGGVGYSDAVNGSVMVPMTHRELSMLKHLYDHADPRLPFDAVMRGLVDDFECRAKEISKGETDLHAVLDRHQDGAEMLLEIGQWAYEATLERENQAEVS